MKLLSFIRYDIKRLFGHGKTALLAVLGLAGLIVLFKRLGRKFLAKKD